MKVCCISDLHGELPSLPQSDLVIIAGDLCPEGDAFHQWRWTQTHFRPWVKQFKQVVYIAGNHDRVFNQTPEISYSIGDNAKYLEDSYTDFAGFSIYGTPWSLKFGGYSFMRNEADIANGLSGVQADIVISHGPPYGVGDLAHGRHCGSGALLEFIKRTSPRLVVVGHIHEGYGVYQLENSTIVNASLRDEYMAVSNEFIMLEI